MKIAFLSQPGYTVLPPAGSLEIWTREVARRLAARGHDVTIYASRVRDAEDTVDASVRYRFIDHATDTRVSRVVRPWYRLLPRDRAFFSSRAYQLLYWRRAARQIARDGNDVIHVYNYSQALPFARRASPRAVVALHMQCEWLTQLARPMLARRLAHADLVVGCSEYITSRIAGRFPEYADRTATIYNGVEPGAGADGNGNGRTDGGLRLLHVGRISPEKGHHFLVRAFNRLVERHPDISLTFVGEESLIPIEMAVDLFDEETVAALREFYSGSYLERVRSELSPQALERVRFTGRVGHEEAVAAYREADLFVFPSMFESFGIPPVEAMGAGLPVVATAVGGVTETIRHRETGLLVESGDVDALTEALEELIVNPELRRSLAAAGQRRAAELFSWDSVCDSFLRLTSGARTPA